MEVLSDIWLKKYLIPDYFEKKILDRLNNNICVSIKVKSKKSFQFIKDLFLSKSINISIEESFHDSTLLARPIGVNDFFPPVPIDLTLAIDEWIDDEILNTDLFKTILDDVECPIRALFYYELKQIYCKLCMEVLNNSTCKFCVWNWKIFRESIEKVLKSFPTTYWSFIPEMILNLPFIVQNYDFQQLDPQSNIRILPLETYVKKICYSMFNAFLIPWLYNQMLQERIIIFKQQDRSYIYFIEKETSDDNKEMNRIIFNFSQIFAGFKSQIPSFIIKNFQNQYENNCTKFSKKDFYFILYRQIWEKIIYPDVWKTKVNAPSEISLGSMISSLKSNSDFFYQIESNVRDNNVITEIFRKNPYFLGAALRHCSNILISDARFEQYTGTVIDKLILEIKVSLELDINFSPLALIIDSLNINNPKVMDATLFYFDLIKGVTDSDLSQSLFDQKKFRKNFERLLQMIGFVKFFKNFPVRINYNLISNIKKRLEALESYRKKIAIFEDVFSEKIDKSDYSKIKTYFLQFFDLKIHVSNELQFSSVSSTLLDKSIKEKYISSLNTIEKKLNSIYYANFPVYSEENFSSIADIWKLFYPNTIVKDLFDSFRLSELIIILIVDGGGIWNWKMSIKDTDNPLVTFFKNLFDKPDCFINNNELTLKGLFKPLITPVPSKTATGMFSIFSGKYPCDHEIIGNTVYYNSKKISLFKSSQVPTTHFKVENKIKDAVMNDLKFNYEYLSGFKTNHLNEFIAGGTQTKYPSDSLPEAIFHKHTTGNQGITNRHNVFVVSMSADIDRATSDEAIQRETHLSISRTVMWLESILKLKLKNRTERISIIITADHGLVSGNENVLLDNVLETNQSLTNDYFIKTVRERIDEKEYVKLTIFYQEEPIGYMYPLPDSRVKNIFFMDSISETIKQDFYELLDQEEDLILLAGEKLNQYKIQNDSKRLFDPVDAILLKQKAGLITFRRDGSTNTFGEFEKFENRHGSITLSECLVPLFILIAD